jgi:hypothetical protein
MVIGAFCLGTIADDGFSQGKKKRKRKKKGMMKEEGTQGAKGGESAPASYQVPYGMAGCGLGSVLIKQDGFMQVFAATLNGTGGNQIFAISTGSSNCKPVKDEMAQQEQEVFISANLASLSKDAARGEGEYLYNLSEVMGCNDGGHYPAFAELSRQNFGEVFVDTDASAIRNRYVAIINNDDILSKSCSRVVSKS